jgi:hypothetical protein
MSRETQRRSNLLQKGMVRVAKGGARDLETIVRLRPMFWNRLRGVGRWFVPAGQADPGEPLAEEENPLWP